jgi:5-(carboxyamino)imidazole ribonucleotide synthase
MGYDGKGQIVLKSNDEIEKAWGAMNNQALILEQFIPFDRELSILAVRTEGGTVSFYPLIENIHRNGILHKSTAPALNTKGPLTDQAQQAAMKIMSELLYVGVLTIEFFEKDGILIANEMAPRVHNSGHWSIEGAVTSQFENHLRAVTGMELGSTEITQPSVMFNIIGSVPDLSSIENNPHIFIHLYGKESRAGRKLGHVTMVSPSEELIARMKRILE